MDRRLAIILAVMAPRADLRFDWREYGKYGMTAGGMVGVRCAQVKKRRVVTDL